ncbi:MAG: anti-sigma factor family protein, partial [Gemmatimonadaceae bacterium]
MTYDETHPDLDGLGDYLDGLLASDRKVATDAHLARCTDCRARLGALRLLVARAADAPRELAPEADLWPAIRGRIEARRAAALFVATPARAAGARRRRLAVGAAIVGAAVAASSALTALLLGRAPAGGGAG